MPSAPTVAIDLGRRRLRAVEVRAGRAGLHVRRRIDVALPDEVARGTDDERGAWAGRTLAEAGLGRARAVVAFSRDDASLKTITLPTAEAAELPDMVRLALQRELPIDAETAQIDFVPVRRDDRSTTVIAVAAAQPAIESARAAMVTAGVRPARFGLRAFGTARLLRSMQLPAEGVLAVDVTGEGVELTVVADGQVRFSRGAPLPPGPDGFATAESIVTETRRTWLSYRASREAEPSVRRAIVLGDAETAAAVAPAIAEIVGAPVEILQRHPEVAAGSAAGTDAGDGAPGTLWPLLGMLLEDRGAALDLGSPRRAPDLASRRRQRVLLAGAAVVIAALAGYTVGAKSRQREVDRRDELVQKANAATSEAWRFRRDEMRLRHLEMWSVPEWDWLERLAALHALLPEPGDGVLDMVSAKQETGAVRWDRDGGWSVDGRTRIVLEGEARTRRRADELRERLLARSGFVVTTSGSDTRNGTRLPFSFGYLLQSEQTSRMPTAGRSTAAAARESSS